MATIREIAERSGVSPATVSNVLNNKLGIAGPESRNRILKAAEELGYRVNRQARQLRKGSTLTINIQVTSTVVTNNTGRPTVTLNLLMLQGISTYVHSRGYKINLLIPQLGKDTEEIERQIIRENSVDGIILMGLVPPLTKELTEIFQKLKKLEIPAATLDMAIGSLGIPAVSVDLSNGFASAMARVKEYGHKAMAYIGRREYRGINERASRFSIFREELERHGMEFPEPFSLEAGSEIEAYQGTLDLIQRSGPRPTCIFYSSDHLAMAGVEALIRCGLNVPRDISVIGLDNAPYNHACKVPLATIDQHHFNRGMILAKLLLDQIQNKENPVPILTMVNSTFVERESLGPAPTRG